MYFPSSLSPPVPHSQCSYPSIPDAVKQQHREKVAAGESQVALASFSRDPQTALYLSTCRPTLLFFFSFSISRHSLSSMASDLNSSLTIYMCLD